MKWRYSWHKASKELPTEKGDYLVRLSWGRYCVLPYSTKWQGWNINELTGNRESEVTAVTWWTKIDNMNLFREAEDLLEEQEKGKRK